MGCHDGCMNSDQPHSPTLIHLFEEMFHRDERELLDAPGMTVSTFRYPSGVAALRVRTDRVETILLPFRGQQVWRHVVDGEDLTMRTHFTEPAASTLFPQTYGPFMLHCGLTGIGHPGPDDTHAHHGELPNITYDRAWLEVTHHEAPGQQAPSEGTRATRITMSGQVALRSSHSLDLLFEPRLTLAADSTTMSISATITNRRRTPYAYSYLCHINFPMAAGTLVQPVELDAEHFQVFPTASATKDTAEYIEAITKDPASSSSITLDTPLDPEYCALLTPTPDSAGWARFRMIREDRSELSVSFATDRLPHAIRWLSNTGDEQAAGFCLPTTAHHLGRAAAEAAGMLVELGPGESHEMRVNVDVVPATD